MSCAANAEHTQTDEDPTHPFEIGKIVSVIRLPVHGAPFDEGLAVIKAPAPKRHRYRIRFIGDPRVCVRFVHPAYQADPRRTLRWLRELWHAEIEAKADLDDFFPPET